jgi:phosphoenolpyruvate carboxykinase (GTP)
MVSHVNEMTRLTTRPPQYTPRISFSSGKLKLPKSLQLYIEEKVKLCQPDEIHICDGSEEENKLLLSMLEGNGSVKRLKKLQNW